MRSDSRRGFTLVEVLVVIAIIAILASLALAGATRLQAGARQELQRSSLHIHALLRAARVYADTFRVNTAVVYNLDGYVDPPNNGLARPVADVITGQHIRFITGAAVLYELPRASGHFQGMYVPVPDAAGAFNRFEGEQVLLLNDPRTSAMQPFYLSDLARYHNDAPVNRIADLGMRGVDVVLDPTGPFAEPRSPAWLNPVTARFAAHVFAPGGRLDTAGSLERFTIFVAPPPDSPEGELVLNPDDRTSGRVYRALHLFRSTGRVKIAS